MASQSAIEAKKILRFGHFGFVDASALGQAPSLFLAFTDTHYAHLRHRRLMRLSRKLLLVVLLATPTAARAQSSSLSSPVSLKVGDLGALLLHNILVVRQDLSDPTVVTYEADPGVIDVEIFGTTSSVERAKDMVGRYWEFIRTGHIPYMQRRFGVRLNEQNYRIMYYDRTARETKLVLTFAGGQYVIAP